MGNSTLPRRPAAEVTLSPVVRALSLPGHDIDEIYVAGLSPSREAADARRSAAEAYESAATYLAKRKARVVQERAFGALAVEAEVIGARADATDGCPAFGAVPPVYLEGRPCDGDGFAGLHLVAVASREGQDEVAVETICHEGQPVGHLIRRPGLRQLYLSGMCATFADTARAETEQARIMFDMANATLQAHGFVYRQVARTWIYIGDILSWYDDFNPVRTEAYHRFGLLGCGDDYLPASTGIQARSPGEIACTMDLVAVAADPEGDLTLTVLHNPLQNEAHSYGSAFARAMEVSANGVQTVYVSGTASIDEFGESIHLDDMAGQVERVVRNIEALIGTRDLTLDDVVQATVFVKRAEDLETYLDVCRGTRFEQIGVPMVADVCRPELLFEIDAVAGRGAALPAES